MPFLESPRFPDDLSFWAAGGRGFKTTVVETDGGDEYRNQAWQFAKGEYDISEAMRSENVNSTYAYTVIRNMHLTAHGQLYAFRFRDWKDYKDEGGGVLGTTGVGVASTLIYQMFKNYALSPLTYQQIVQKPYVGATRVFKNGVLQLLGTDYTIDESTGLVTFSLQPAIGTPITWTGMFDIPVRFADDLPRFGPDTSGALYSWQSLKLVEVRNP